MGFLSLLCKYVFVFDIAFAVRNFEISDQNVTVDPLVIFIHDMKNAIKLACLHRFAVQSWTVTLLLVFAVSGRLCRRSLTFTLDNDFFTRHPLFYLDFETRCRRQKNGHINFSKSLLKEGRRYG